MRCAIWMTASIVGLLLMAGGVLAGEPAGSSSNIAAGGDDQPMKQRLQRKWIVRQVKHGEKPTGAQIGQQPGDIIEVVLTETGLFLS